MNPSATARSLVLRLIWAVPFLAAWAQGGWLRLVGVVLGVGWATAVVADSVLSLEVPPAAAPAPCSEAWLNATG
ncbi:MAG TPA: hypothetical protein VNF50_03915 [Acidimicrobiales bacterium]|nr:hypothetical protein [Acidimicrobiales bacterium]